MTILRIIIAIIVAVGTILGFIALWMVWDAYQNLPDHDDHQ
jgi:uncharacterized phage infection (PIP) family protein YhgE